MGTQQHTLEAMLRTYLDDIPGGDQGSGTKVINIRSLKVFLLVQACRGISAHEVENLVEYLDRDGNGFVGLYDLEREINFNAPS